MESDFLTKIVDYKKSLLEKKKAFFDGLRQSAGAAQMTRYKVFKNEISKAGKINLIAEIKKASPSKGLIAEDFDILKLARIYAENGADAVSVLTEDKYFLGKPGYIRKVTEEIKVPILRKDFIIDEAQIYESFLVGASAVLLIAAIVDDEQLKQLIQLASHYDMDSLVEIHDESEMDRALKAGAEIIGINNRDLRSFHVDMNVCARLIPHVPKGKVIVAESGIKTHQDILQLKEFGAHAVLIGETFLRAPDIGEKIREVMTGEA